MSAHRVKHGRPGDLPVLLVLAKAPVPGEVKTRLHARFSPVEAAELAAAALLDTLAVLAGVPAAARVVALSGELTAASCSGEVRRALRDFLVLPQRGHDLGSRLAQAHGDVARIKPGTPVLQVGMDTPQLTANDLRCATDRLVHRDVVLGPARDGGWWLLGLRDPQAARQLVAVPMSRPDTLLRTRRAFADARLTIGVARMLRDLDTPEDLPAVASGCAPGSWTAAVTARLGWRSAAAVAS